MGYSTRMRMRALPALMSAALFLLPGGGPTAYVHGQVSTKIASLGPREGIAGQPLTISAELQQGETIERAYLVYRPFGRSEYERGEMDIIWNTASFTIPARSVIPPFLEFYLVLVDRNGTLETFPLSETKDPFSTPPEKTVHMPIQKEEEGGTEAVFLSPEPMSVLAPEDVLISVSLLRADSVVARPATRLSLDGADVTAQAVLSGDLLVYSPPALPPGEHRATVRLFDGGGNLFRVSSLVFIVQGFGQEAAARPPAGGWNYGASVQLESRHEEIGPTGTWYNRAGVSLNGRNEDWRFTSNTFLTSDEKSERQPQDRFFVGGETRWLKIGYGDSYPAFPNLILSGKRVRGLNSSLRLGWFNVDLAMGQINRAVEGALLQTIDIAHLADEQARDPSGAYAPIDAQTWGKYGPGTYARNVFVVRPSFGSGDTWKVGFTWLKAKDDTGSIRYGIRPQENFVLGSDFLARLDAGKIEIAGQGAFSAFNADISSGTFTDAYIDSVYKNDAGTIKHVRDILGNIITVNDNLRPLSLKKPATAAYDLSLGLNYFDNVFKLAYLFRGTDYNSFGQTFLRKDIQGFNLVDRLPLLRNQIYATLGYERLHDNTTDVKAATTVFTNVNVAFTYSGRTDIPAFTLGFARFANDNGLRPTAPDTLGFVNIVNDVTNRFFLQSSYDLDFLEHHTATVNVSTSTRDDQSPRHLNVRNVTVDLGLATMYRIPLQTSVDVAVNLNELPADSGRTLTLNYTTIALQGKLAIVRDVLSCSATVSPTVGDFKRTALDAGVDWRFIPAMSFQLEFSFFRNPGAANDNFVSMRYRYDL